MKRPSSQLCCSANGTARANTMHAAAETSVCAASPTPRSGVAVAGGRSRLGWSAWLVREAVMRGAARPSAVARARELQPVLAPRVLDEIRQVAAQPLLEVARLG